MPSSAFPEPAMRDALGMLAHDLRTPLHGILGFLEVLSHTEMDASQRASLAAARMCGEDLLETLNGILDGVNADTGEVMVNEDWNGLGDVLGGIAEVFEPQAALHGIRFHWSVNPGMPEWWRFDRCKLRQILANLLGNALKFTNEGVVSLEAGMDAAGSGVLEVRVKDTGAGMPEGELRRLLEARSPEAPVARRRDSRNGLGLVIVHKLARLLGGEVRIFSVEGLGTEIVLRFPWESRDSPPGDPAQGVR